jgi:hypothetical protein
VLLYRLGIGIAVRVSLSSCGTDITADLACAGSATGFVPVALTGELYKRLDLFASRAILHALWNIRERPDGKGIRHGVPLLLAASPWMWNRQEAKEPLFEQGS